MLDGAPEALAESDLIQQAFRLKGRFVQIGPQAPPHLDVELARWNAPGALPAAPDATIARLERCCASG